MEKKKEFTVVKIKLLELLGITLFAQLYRGFTKDGLIEALIVFLVFNFTVAVFSGFAKRFSKKKFENLVSFVSVLICVLYAVELWYLKLMVGLATYLVFAIMIPIVLVVIGESNKRRPFRFEQVWY